MLGEDLERIENKINTRFTIKELSEILKESDERNITDLNLYFKYLTPQLFRQWLFKHLDIPLIPFSNEGLEIYKKSIIVHDDSELRKIFSLDYIIPEIYSLNERKSKRNLLEDDIQQIRKFTASYS